MNEKSKEGKKPMKLPRFSYQVPEDLTTDFLHEMKDELRETPGDCVTAILRKHFQRKVQAQMLKAFDRSVQGELVPVFGPAPVKESPERRESQSGSEE